MVNLVLGPRSPRTMQALQGDSRRMSAGAGWWLLALLERLSLGVTLLRTLPNFAWNSSTTGAKAKRIFVHGDSVLEILTRSSDSRLPAKKTNNLA